MSDNDDIDLYALMQPTKADLARTKRRLPSPVIDVDSDDDDDAESLEDDIDEYSLVPRIKRKRAISPTEDCDERRRHRRRPDETAFSTRQHRKRSSEENYETDTVSRHVKRRHRDRTPTPDSTALLNSDTEEIIEEQQLETCPCLDWDCPSSFRHLSDCPILKIQQNPIGLRPWVDWNDELSDPLLLYTDRDLKEDEGNNVHVNPSIFDEVDAPVHQTGDEGGDELLRQGKRRLDRFVDIINYARQHIDDCNKVYPVVDQILHHYFAQLHRLIAGKACYEKYSVELHEYTHTTPKKQQSFMICGRQCGKTSTLSLILAALISCADGGDLCRIYASKQDQAALILIGAKLVHNKLPENLRNNNITKYNEHTFGVISEYDGFEAVITANCSNLDGVRGHAPALILLDEFMLIEKPFMESHINQIAAKDDRPLIAVSTPGMPGTYMLTECLKLRANPDKYPFKELLDLSLVCHECRATGDVINCRHLLSRLPPWRPSEYVREEIDKNGEAGAETTIRELFGEPTQGGEHIFDFKLLEKTFNRPPVCCTTFEPAAETIYISFDPAHGGKCDLGMVTSCWGKDANLYILGLESYLTNQAADQYDCERIVLAHVQKLRELYPRWTGNATLVPLVEDNRSPIVANTLASIILKKEECMPSKSYLHRMLKNKMLSRGRPTDEDSKEEMVIQLKELMHEGRLQFCEQLFSTGLRSCLAGETPVPVNVLKQMLHNQLSNFHYDRKSSKQKHITGIVSIGDKDDLGMALLLNLYHSRNCRRENPELIDRCYG